jgi:hypothetical protein
VMVKGSKASKASDIAAALSRGIPAGGAG